MEVDSETKLHNGSSQAQSLVYDEQEEIPPTISVPGSTVDLKAEASQSEQFLSQSAMQLIADDSNMEGSIPSLKDIHKGGRSRIKDAKDLFAVNRSHKVAPDENVRPSSAPQSSAMEGIKKPKRPMTAAGFGPRRHQIVPETDTTSLSSVTPPALQPKRNIEEQIESVKDVVRPKSAAQSELSVLTNGPATNETPYVPYEYARAMISRIVDDMKEMKLNHLKIVSKIESQYQGIENETRNQFEVFLKALQEKHQVKIRRFEKVIELLKNELSASNTQRMDTVRSLQERNNELLRDKKAILDAQKHQYVGATAVQQPFVESLPTTPRATTPSKPAQLQIVETQESQDELKIADDLQEKEKPVDSDVEIEEVPERAEEPKNEKDVEASKSAAQAEDPDHAEEVEATAEAQEGIHEEIDDTELSTKIDEDVEMQPEPEDQLEESDTEALDVQIEDEVDHVGKSAVAAAVVTTAAAAGSKRSSVKQSSASDQQLAKAKALLAQARKDNAAYAKQIQALEKKLKSGEGAAPTGSADPERKKIEKKIKDLEKKLEMEAKKSERDKKLAGQLKDELQASAKETADLKKELTVKEAELVKLQQAAGAGAIALQQVPELQEEVKQLTLQNKTLTDNYNSERVLRKKYYNMVEDMKGKIRVYCRVRPLSSTEKQNGNKNAVHSPDDYTVKVEDNRRDLKEFQFDQIFTKDHTQENVFEDTYTLVQSAIDGYNVCIFAYGQTGSGKTYTMIGDSDRKYPGIAPRAFQRIFEVIESGKQKFSFQVSCYMMELYNDKLIDLLLSQKGGEPPRLDIKKDQKGMVFVLGATVLSADSSDDLEKIFNKGSESRHVASTKMNSESSRSHLIIGVVVESTNLTTGAVTRGKLSLVDLAGSERVGKTGATATQLKEANSINKSLSALGDVISALSSEQSFIPYRNNKLTMLMQDSLGGNAKTLMFVNISPADYNAAESIISLTYAARVKLITNDASKNAETKEVARLKRVIAKLKAGEDLDPDDD